MNKFSEYTYTATNWRKQLHINESRSRMVIGVFILIYIGIGLVIDLHIHSLLDQYSIIQAIELLLTFQVMPIATLLSSAIAVVSLLITYALHDRIMLLGTEYHEIKRDGKSSFDEQQLYNIVEELKIAAGLHYMPRIYVIDAEYMNAFASGYSEKSALIAITRGLLNKLDRNELQAVIAHELSHIRHHDIKLTLFASVLANLMFILLDIFFRGIIFGGRNRQRSGNKNGIAIIIILLRLLLPVITIFLMLYLSRRREFMADAGAVELMRDNVPLAKALIKISDDHTANKEQYKDAYDNTAHEEVRYAAYIFDPKQMGFSISRPIGSIFSTHPSLAERLDAIGFSSASKQ